MRKIAAVFILFTLFAIATPEGILAQVAPWDVITAGCEYVVATYPDGTKQKVATLDCIPAIFKNIVFGALMFVGVVAVFMVVYAGIRYVTSKGDPKAVEGAKQTLTWAIIGLIVVLVSFFIISLISFLTGISCLKFFDFKYCS